MDSLTGLVAELSAQFPAVPFDEVRRHCAEAMQELGGSVPALAVPEMLTRLVRLRLMAALLEDDRDLAAALCTTDSLTVLARTVRAAVTARLGCAGASLVLLDGDQCFHADEDPIAPMWAGQRFRVGECLAWWSIGYGQVAVISDVNCDERVPPQAYRSAQVRSMVTVPIPGPQGTTGAIGGYWPDARQARRADVGWLQRLAQATGAVIADVGLGGAPWAPNFRTRFPARRR
ncbi:MAG TPA: GAF domain-containing protein [Jatrophihabitans sp.]|nr:GAF domain-containing protein [Jatrophihabitans sp.]